MIFSPITPALLLSYQVIVYLYENNFLWIFLLGIYTPQRKLGYDITVWRFLYLMWLFNLTRCNCCGYCYQNLSVLLLNPLFPMQTLCWLEARAPLWRLQGLRFSSEPRWAVHQLVGMAISSRPWTQFFMGCFLQGSAAEIYGKNKK